MAQFLTFKLNDMQETIRLLNELRDQQNKIENYECSLKIGAIIRSLLDENSAIHQKHYKDSLNLLERLTQ
jgi:hypothetical protein